MLNSDGEVIGISQQIKGGSGASDGVGFGVPSNAITYSAKQLEEDGEANYAYIGVSTQPLYPQLAEKLGIKTGSGALVAKVIPGGPADDAGIKGSDNEITFQGSIFDTGGDVIVSIDGQRIKKAQDLGRVVGRLAPGDTVELGVVRDGKEVNVRSTSQSARPPSHPGYRRFLQAKSVDVDSDSVSDLRRKTKASP